jgi:hypothetical protein
VTPVGRLGRGVVAGSWALVAVASAHRQVRWRPLSAVRMPEARWCRTGGDRAVALVLDATRARCLVRALVLRELHRVREHPLDLVIGVASPGTTSLDAHAWLEDAASGAHQDVVAVDPVARYTPILRLPAGR